MSASNCFSYQSCPYYNWSVCLNVDTSRVYNDVSAAWVLIAAMIVFFMKAGFMLVELSFAHDLREQRHVVIIKYIDACASAFGFFLIGFGAIARYTSPQGLHVQFFQISDPVLWFFKFTFASNTATIIGGCLVTNRYKLRLPAAFISAFVISGIIHPLITFLIWSDHCKTLSPYRFCQDGQDTATQDQCPFSCNSTSLTLGNKMYVLDFAGGGAVHLVGGVASLVICLLVKLQHWRDKRTKKAPDSSAESSYAEIGETPQPKNFIEWMYPANGGSERVGEAALGVIILWFCWFAFNCGSTNSLQSSNPGAAYSREYNIIPFHGVPSIIALNMILATATGGIVAVSIATWAQLYFRTVSVNANEIANGILASLVAITAGCPFVDYWGACLIGFVAVILYHVGCYIEYKLGIEDTARVVPVHGVCGLWSLLAVGLLVASENSECNLHSTFEGLCYCELRLPTLSYFERLLFQIVGAIMMIGITGIMTVVVYGLLYITPIQPFVKAFSRLLCLNSKGPLMFRGNWLLTSPVEDQMLWGMMHHLATPLSTPLPSKRNQEEFEESEYLESREHCGSLLRSRTHAELIINTSSSTGVQSTDLSTPLLKNNSGTE